MSYATPEAFKNALEARIRKIAAERGQPIPRVRQLIVFDRFLARVFDVFGERAIVKGGAALELRLDRARTTRDIDLRMSGSPEQLSSLLQRAAELDLGDHISFKLDLHPTHPTIEGDGIVYEGRRFRAEARLAGKIYGDRFGVDAGFGDVLTAAAEERQGSDLLAFADIAPTRYRIYPREAHVAEKLYAYTLPRTRENTRIKDLPDLALLAMTGTFDAEVLRKAMGATFAFRNTHALPSALPSPPPGWSPDYSTIARRDALPWPDLESVFQAARDFLDPILSEHAGVWIPEQWSWTTSR